MRNNNGAVIRRLSARSLKNSRMRNLFAIFAIILTGMLFTATFSLFSGAVQVGEESTMREVGTKSHAGLKDATLEQYEKVCADPLVKKSNYNILIGYAQNVLKRQAEIRYLPKEEWLSDSFITLKEGHLPKNTDEILVDSIVMNALGIEHKTGVKIPISFTFLDETIEREFTVSGWYEGDWISHASELFISESLWEELRGIRTDEDFLAWGNAHPNDMGVGLVAGNLWFDNASDLYKKVQTVITNAGYVPETELNYGVNWAYMGSRMSSVDPLNLFLLLGTVLVILITGYLIIYNIFQISVIGDIRFYGLLKTIGTTKKQLRRLILRQAMLLSTIGIPIGLLLGFCIGKLLLPYALSFMNYGTMEISLKMNPWIFVFGAVFSIVTVFLSCRRPGKIAGSVSPVEAVKYTEGMKSGSFRKKKLHSGYYSPVSMAMRNLGRNKGKLAVVVASISLSMILFTLVMTAAGSFQLDGFFEQRIPGDILISDVNLLGTARYSPEGPSDAYQAVADSQEGILDRSELWTGFGKNIKLDEKGLKQYQKLDLEGKIRRDEFTDNNVKQILSGEKSLLRGYIYGYSDSLLEKVRVLSGELDIEAFQKGDYILIERFYGNDHLEDTLYEPGDFVTVSSITDASEGHEIKDENGETIDIEYDNREEKQYEVMAIVEIPESMKLHRSSPNSMDVALPLRELTDPSAINSVQFAISYQVEEQAQDGFEAAVKDYTEQADPMMAYASKSSLKKEFNGMVQVMGVIGIVLSAVIALIGLLNFVNAILTGIISRRQEFAMLQSIGMTKEQLKKMLVCEGIGYIMISAVISLCLGSLLSWLILRALNNVVMFFAYRFQILPFLIMLPALLLAAVAGPLAAYGQLQKKSIVERLREAE